jgi:hypothetical protein
MEEPLKGLDLTVPHDSSITSLNERDCFLEATHFHTIMNSFPLIRKENKSILTHSLIIFYLVWKVFSHSITGVSRNKNIL